MGYTIDIKADDGVLRVRVTGTVEDSSTGVFKAEVFTIVEACAADRCKGILLDVRGLSIELGIAARLHGMAAFARAIPAGVRLATIGVSHPAALTGFERFMAATQGLLYKPFDGDSEAVAWLRAGKSPPSSSLAWPPSGGEGSGGAGTT